MRYLVCTLAPLLAFHLCQVQLIDTTKRSVTLFIHAHLLGPQPNKESLASTAITQHSYNIFFITRVPHTWYTHHYSVHVHWNNIIPLIFIKTVSRLAHLGFQSALQDGWDWKINVAMRYFRPFKPPSSDNEKPLHLASAPRYSPNLSTGLSARSSTNCLSS